MFERNVTEESIVWGRGDACFWVRDFMLSRVLESLQIGFGNLHCEHESLLGGICSAGMEM